MPELPDVEVFKNYLNETALHARIARVEVREKSLLGEVSEGNLDSRLKGSRFERSFRHGKYLFVEAANEGWLVLHFGMTGFLRYYKNVEQSGDHTRLRIDFKNGFHLAFDCQRKLGLIDWVEDPKEFIRKKELGDDPLSEHFDLSRFTELLEGKRGSVKSALMNQSVIAGIGNIYSDEILFHAGIHPKTRVSRLAGEEMKTLFSALKEVLDTAVKARADPKEMPAHFLISVRGEKEKCPKCGGRIEKVKVSGRTSYFCSGHQRLT